MAIDCPTGSYPNRVRSIFTHKTRKPKAWYIRQSRANGKRLKNANSKPTTWLAWQSRANGDRLPNGIRPSRVRSIFTHKTRKPKAWYIRQSRANGKRLQNANSKPMTWRGTAVARRWRSTAQRDQTQQGKISIHAQNTQAEGVVHPAVARQWQATKERKQQANDPGSHGIHTPMAGDPPSFCAYRLCLPFPGCRPSKQR